MDENNLLLIAGGGKFGKKAIIYGKKNGFKNILVDNNPNCIPSKLITVKVKKTTDLQDFLAKANKGDLLFLNNDISIIYEILKEISPNLIIPVVPVHLLAKLIELKLQENLIELKVNEIITKKTASEINEEILLYSIPEKGVIYLSYAKEGEICPDNCIGPEKFCPTFKREKPVTITQYLKNYFEIKDIIKIEKKQQRIAVVLESKQLKAGLGGLRGKDILKIFESLQNNLDFLTKKTFNLTIATTCNCHGVVNFFKTSKS
ncbi:MAG: hypothetical protein P8Y70_03110 [Candidatus Lokiarchaeota archaeon]